MLPPPTPLTLDERVKKLFAKRPAPPPKPPKVKRIKRPETERAWTILYYGARGSGKSLHQARLVKQILEYLDWLYWKNPELRQAIVYSIQKFNPNIEKKYLGHRLFYWNAEDPDTFRYCPRINCWRGSERHNLHGAYLVFDDMATFLPADGWANTPLWMRKLFAQARHNGIRVISNVQDPFSCDVNFRRYTDLCYKFTKIIGSRDPDETKKPIKRIWGVYMRREIKAEHLWKYGDMAENDILLMKANEEAKAEELGTFNYFENAWIPSLHWISRKVCEIYDTTQDVPEYKPTGFRHYELECLDGCGYIKKSHELI